MRNVFKHLSILTLCLSVLVLVAAIDQVGAYSTTLSFYEGFDVNTGDKENDPTVLIIVVGDTEDVKDILEIEGLDRPFDFSSPVDVYFEFDPVSENPIMFVSEEAVKLAFLDGTAYDAVNYDSVGTLSFEEYPAQEFAFDTNDTVVLMAADDTYYKVGHASRQADWTLALDFQKLEQGGSLPPAAVPEPSTLLLLGLGLLGLPVLLRRMKKKGISHLYGVFLLLIACFVIGVTAFPQHSAAHPNHGPNEFHAGEYIQFDPTGMFSLPMTQVIRYEWNFGDGITQTTTPPNGDVVHMFIEEGDYVVSAKVVYRFAFWIYEKSIAHTFHILPPCCESNPEFPVPELTEANAACVLAEKSLNEQSDKFQLDFKPCMPCEELQLSFEPTSIDLPLDELVGKTAVTVEAIKGATGSYEDKEVYAVKEKGVGAEFKFSADGVSVTLKSGNASLATAPINKLKESLSKVKKGFDAFKNAKKILKESTTPFVGDWQCDGVYDKGTKTCTPKKPLETVECAIEYEFSKQCCPSLNPPYKDKHKVSGTVSADFGSVEFTTPYIRVAAFPCVSLGATAGLSIKASAGIGGETTCKAAKVCANLDSEFSPTLGVFLAVIHQNILNFNVKGTIKASSGIKDLCFDFESSEFSLDQWKRMCFQPKISGGVELISFVTLEYSKEFEETCSNLFD